MSRDHSQNHYGPNASFDGYDSDLASAGILIDSLQQQLAAALAACKLKDEALKEVQMVAESSVKTHGYDKQHVRNADVAKRALSTAPDQALEQFAERVREQCALICDEHADDPVYCGAAIRAIKELPQ